jgi:prepilin-type N-terminal cleavage/methylation domain-containing protein
VNRSVNGDLWTVWQNSEEAVAHPGNPAAAGAGRSYRAGGRRARGFTLLELLVVVTIIGLLAAYVGPKYFSQLGKSEQGVAKAQVEAFARALDTYRLDVGHYPTTEEGLNALLTKPANAAQVERAVSAEGGARLIPGAGRMCTALRAPTATSTSPRMARMASPVGPAMRPTSQSMRMLLERGCALKFVPYLPTT